LDFKKTDEVTKEALEQKFKTKTQEEWVKIFKDLDACVSPVLTLDEAPFHPHNIENNSFIKIDSDNYLPNMSWLNEMNTSSRSFEMPLVGQHTSHILKEHGYSNEDIKEFLNEQIIYENLESGNITKSKL
jgi:alpha-methylacyl-CoA racemase